MTSVLYVLDDVGCLRAFNNILTMLSEKLGNVGFVINHFHAGRKTCQAWHWSLPSSLTPFTFPCKPAIAPDYILQIHHNFPQASSSKVSPSCSATDVVHNFSLRVSNTLNLALATSHTSLAPFS